MSKAQIPAYVDVRKVFDQEAEFSGLVSLDRLPRFTECLASDQGQVSAELKFSVSDSGLRVVTGEIAASANVACQRCLEPVSIDLADDIALAVLDSEEQLDTLEKRWDPWIIDGPRIQLAALVEEQLMLCLPLVSYHEDPDCVAALGYQQVSPASAADQSESTGESPFAMLKVLKENDETV